MQSRPEKQSLRNILRAADQVQQILDRLQRVQISCETTADMRLHVLQLARREQTVFHQAFVLLCIRQPRAVVVDAEADCLGAANQHERHVGGEHSRHHIRPRIHPEDGRPRCNHLSRCVLPQATINSANPTRNHAQVPAITRPRPAHQEQQRETDRQVS